MNGQPERRTLEQERAAFAWEQIRLLEALGDKAKEAGMYIRKVPAMTFSNGLGQTLAFLFGKAEGVDSHPAFKVYQILADWLIRRRIYIGEPENLIKTIAEGDRYQYQLAQEEIWALLNWLKKFADAFLVKEPAKSLMDQGR